jgi:hypothetical protein
LPTVLHPMNTTLVTLARRGANADAVFAMTDARTMPLGAASLGSNIVLLQCEGSEKAALQQRSTRSEILRHAGSDGEPILNLFHRDEEPMQALLRKFLSWRASQETSILSKCVRPISHGGPSARAR